MFKPDPDDDVTTTPMFDEDSPWYEVHDAETGEYEGSEHDVVGGTEIYDDEGEYSGFRDNDGNEYDAEGNLLYDDDDDDDDDD